MANTEGMPGKIFEGRIRELIKCSEYAVKFSDFLTPLEQRVAFDIANSAGEGGRCFFWGGALDAQRRVMFMLPEWMLSYESTLGGAFDSKREEIIYSVMKEIEDEEFSTIVPLEIVGSGYETLEHRDYMGALLALGIERSEIGDIAVLGDSRCAVFVKSHMASVIKESLSKAGRDTVKVYDGDLEEGFRVPFEFESVNETVMSCRLDGVVKAVYKLSREAAAELVEKGEVALNYMTETKCDRALSPGDVISVRGHGKFIYDGNGGLNRRGRLKIYVRKYI